MAEKLCHHETTDDEVEGSIITSENTRKYFELPDSLIKAHLLSKKGILNRGMEMVGNSLKAHRSCNEAIIFVYGVSGAGKSASINHLFGFDIISISDESKVDTKLVTEYVATMQSEEWGVSNLQIGFIDMPGWNDARGEVQDISNIAMIDQFVSNHPYLGSNLYKCYPSIVMIAIKANDNRLVGENSQVVRMFRALTKLKIIDKDRPNLLIILTHVMEVGRRRFNDNLKNVIAIIKELAKSYLNIEPAITYVENKYEDHELEEKGDWTILRDGTLQPKNVFEAMMQLTGQHKDEVGHEAIRLYFASRGTNKPVITRQSVPGTLREYEIRRWRSIIAQEFANAPRNEVSQALQTYADKHPDICSKRSLVSLMIELNARSLSRLDTLQSMTLNQVQERLAPYQLSQVENQSLVEGCGVKPYQFPDILQNIGYGMNAETGELTHSPTLELPSDWYVHRGVKVPKSMHVVKPIEKRRVEWKRLSEYNSAHDLMAGQMLTPPSTGIPGKYQFQITYSVYTVKLILSDHQLLLSQLSPGFKEAVTALPESSIVEGNQVRREYVDFFNTYGHWVIVGCECGGCVEGELEMEERDTTHLQKHFTVYINNLLDRLESEDVSTSLPISSDNIIETEHIYEPIGRKALNWKGGDCPGQFTLCTITPQKWQQWTTSLYEKPVILDVLGSSNVKQLQIYQLASLLDNSKCNELHKALTTPGVKFDTEPVNMKSVESSSSGSKEYSMIQTVEYTREGTSKQHASATLKIASGGFPENSICIRGCFEDFSTVQIKDIIENDSVLCRDPYWIKFEKAKGVKIPKVEENDNIFEYFKITHEYGDITLGHVHTVLVKYPFKPPELTLVKLIRPGDVIYYIDVSKKKTLKSKVNEISIVEGRGNYSFQMGGMNMVAVNQILTGGEEPACFPGNASVVLRGGERVRMDELKIGDYVLSIRPTTGKSVYSKVYLWAHRDPHITATFLHITHPQGHLHISANHLILSGDKMRPVPADQLRVGDSVHFLSPCLSQQQLNVQEGEGGGDSHTLISVPVLHIQTCTQVGYYAPFTMNGYLIVDRIATSIFSVTEPSMAQVPFFQSIGQSLFYPMRVLDRFGFGSIVGTYLEKDTKIHKYAQFLKDSYQVFKPVNNLFL